MDLGHCGMSEIMRVMYVGEIMHFFTDYVNRELSEVLEFLALKKFRR